MPGLLDRLRDRAIAAPTRPLRAAALRSLLRHRARRGTWDDRMLNGLPGTVVPGVRREIMRALPHGLVPTSTSEGHPGDGVHSRGSNHYRQNFPDLLGRAVDLGTRRARGNAWPWDHMPQPTAEEARRRKVAYQRDAARTPAAFRELFGPDNRANVKNGQRLALTEGTPLESMHDTHTHAATFG